MSIPNAAVIESAQQQQQQKCKRPIEISLISCDFI